MLEFELEYKREAPISMFYIWYMGHLKACVDILGMEAESVKKIFGVYESGKFSAFTQKDNLNKIKAAIEKKSDGINEVLEGYLISYGKLQANPQLPLDPNFIQELISGFVITFLTGDMQGFQHQSRALELRSQTEKLFYTLWETLKDKVSYPDLINFYSYEEIVSGESIAEAVLKSRDSSLLTPAGILPIGSPAEVKKYAINQGIDLEWLEESGATLTKVYSREHSLFYVYVWNNSDIEAYNIKNLLFLREISSGVVSVWYYQKELDNLLTRLIQKLNNDKSYLDNVKSTFYECLTLVKPYLIKEKGISSMGELKDYFYNLTKWWSVMAIVTATPDLGGLNEDIRGLFLKMREETQEYTDEADNVFINYFSENFPQYQELMLALTPEEIFGLADRPLTSDQIMEVKKREQGFALINNKLVLIRDINRELEANSQILEQGIKEGKQDSIKGNIAFKGKVRGRVRVVLSKKELILVEEGEVLVTSMTTPDYIPALEKAIAFVTDEGGITSHAAIVARELKKPCIIGTKIATQLLKNGDMVEVDADAGIIQIVS